MALTKNQIKHLQSLAQRKYRQKLGFFIAEGPKVCLDLLRHTWDSCELYALPKFLNQHTFPSWVQIFEVNDIELGKISNLKTPNQLLCVFPIPEDAIGVFPENSEKPIIVLDGISDPGNMGTIIRTMNWFGFEELVMTNDCVEHYNPKVVQATMGALRSVRCRYAPAEEIAAQLKGSNYTAFGTFLDGENAFKCNFPLQTALIIGSESHGIRPELAKAVNRKISIPAQKGEKMAESLNASVAGGILIAEMFRKIIF